MHKISWMIITFFLAIVASILLLPMHIAWLMPNWVLLVLLFWVIAMPQHIGLITAFCLGLLLDGLQNTLLGEHVLAMLIVTYLAMKFSYRFRIFNLLEQSFFIFSLMMLYQIMIYCLHGFLGQVPVPWLYWCAPFVAVCAWPLAYAVLKRMRH